jgi:hypothetical protein
MIPTFLTLAPPLPFNQLGLWRIHQCVPSFQPGATSVFTSWHNRLSGSRKDPSRLFLPNYPGPIFSTATLLNPLASPHDL